MSSSIRALAVAAAILTVIPVAAAAVTAPGASTTSATLRWGEDGHRMVGRAAADHLPASMPAFFRQAAAQLSYLNPDPDRWRLFREDTTLTSAMSYFSPDHYVDMELVPAGALAAPDRYAFSDSLHTVGQRLATVGALPYRIYELTDRLRREFSLWRHAPDSATRAWIEQRIINDAGILGHYIADGANPHHTTVHHNGWVGDNPHGYTTDRTFHSRFESEYVRSHITLADFTDRVARVPHTVTPLQDSVVVYLERSRAELDRLYQLDAREPFGEATTGADHREFTADRLAAGATMLRNVWFTAWVTSR